MVRDVDHQGAPRSASLDRERLLRAGKLAATLRPPPPPRRLTIAAVVAVSLALAGIAVVAVSPAVGAAWIAAWVIVAALLVRAIRRPLDHHTVVVIERWSERGIADEATRRWITIVGDDGRRRRMHVTRPQWPAVEPGRVGVLWSRDDLVVGFHPVAD